MQAITRKTDERASVPHAFSNKAHSTFNHAVKIVTALVTAALLAQPIAAYASQPLPPITTPPQTQDRPSSRPARESAVVPPSLNLGSVFGPGGAPVRGTTGSTTPAVQGGFLDTYQKYGLSLIGYPLTPEMNEGGRTVQYFERVKMEWHPEYNSQGTPVLFTRLGADISAGSPFGRVKPFASSAAKTYFDATGHSLAEPFLSFWRKNGSLAFFGYPISEPIHQDGMLVQWFERARMEYHPELASKGTPVLLTLLGRIALSRAGGAAPAASPPPPSAPAPSLTGPESNLLAGINAQRAAAGVPPVSLAPELADFARWRSNDMASHNFFAHTTSDGKSSLQALKDRGISYALAGEILAKNNYAESDAANTAISTFLNSSAHKAIMLDGRYTQVGVGYATGSDGMHYFTAVFLRK